MDIIPKFQQGGGFDSLFTIYQPIQTETSRPSSGGSESKKKDKDDDTKGKLTEKDLYNMLENLDGLPNEMQKLVRNMITTLNNARASGKDGIKDLAVTYLRNLYSLKEAKYNKEQFNKTYTQAVSNKSLNEVAIDPTGNIWITNKQQQLKPVSPTDWAKIKDSGEYQVVTNGNLLWMRSHMPQYANRNEILRIVENGIGLEQVHQMIKSRFNNIKNNKSTTETYIPKEAVKGTKILEDALQYGPEGIYKMKTELSQPDSQAVKAALTYIYSTLPANAKTRLALETENGTQTQVQEVINAMIFGTLNVDQSTSFDYEGLEGKGITKDGKSVTDNDLNLAQRFKAGLGNPENFGINLGDEYLTMVQASTLNLATGKEDDEIGLRKPVSDIFTSSLGNILDSRSMSIGGNIVSPNAMNRIIIEEPKIRSIDFPCKRTEKGEIIPDLSMETRAKKREADAELLRKMGINPYGNDKDYRKINEVYQKHQLPRPYNEDGSINNENWSRFAIIAVSTDGRALGSGDKSLLQEVKDDYEAESIISAIQESDKNYTSTRDDFFGSDAIYKGTLWIPVISSESLAVGTGSTSEALNYNMLDQAFKNKATLTTKQF